MPIVLSNTFVRQHSTNNIVCTKALSSYNYSNVVYLYKYKFDILASKVFP